MEERRSEDREATNSRASKGNRRTESRAAEGLDHLQLAAQEMIAAARVFLDAVEELIEEPEWVTNSVSGLVDAVKDLTGRRNDPWVAHAYAPNGGPTPRTVSEDEDFDIVSSDPVATSKAESSKSNHDGDGPAVIGSDQTDAVVIDMTEPRVNGSVKKPRAKTQTSVKRISVD